MADRPLHGILSDIEFDKNNGLLYVAHRDIISTVNVTSEVVKDIVVGLPMPAYVTHPLGQLAISPTDERIYFSVGGLQYCSSRYFGLGNRMVKSCVNNAVCSSVN